MFSCAAPPRPQPLPKPQPRPAAVPPQRIDNESTLAWAIEEEVFIIVDKGCQLLHVYQHGHLARSYPMVFSRRGGRKLYEGDKRTPVGLYMIIGKRHHPRWSRFMLLDYPTPADVHRYQQHKEKGQVPLHKGTAPGPGDAIGIHGTNHKALNEAQVNWTMGCISLFNPHIRELYARVPPGTLVYIKE